MLNFQCICNNVWIFVPSLHRQLLSEKLIMVLVYLIQISMGLKVAQ